jgi:integrase
MSKKKKLLRSHWPRVRRILVRGQEKFLVDSRPAGGREFWNTAAEALASAELIARQRANEGAASFAELSPAQRRDAAEALAHLDGSGSLLDAARLFMADRTRQAALAHVPDVTGAIEAFLKAKELERDKDELSQLTLWDIQSKMRIIGAELGSLKITDIDEAAVRAFLRKLPYRTGYKSAIRSKLSAFLNYCRREGKWIAANPVTDVQIRVKRGDVKILSLEEIRRLLLALGAVENADAVASYLLVQLFGGLRPWEAFRLRWDRVHFDTGEIEVLGETSKTHETRFVPMEPTLIEWLLPYRKPSGPIVPTTSLKTVLPAIKRQAGFTFGKDKTRPWPKDVLRHCYGSYWLAVHKDRPHLAELMGNSLAIIKRHYRRAIPLAVAQEFWTLSPPEPGKIISIPAAA